MGEGSRVRQRAQEDSPHRRSLELVCCKFAVHMRAEVVGARSKGAVHKSIEIAMVQNEEQWVME
jgi:hypothetical protein